MFIQDVGFAWKQIRGGAAPIRLYLGRSGFPFRSREYTNPDGVAFSKVEVPDALWHESHTFTCFAYPTFGEEDMQQIAGALTKVIKAYATKKCHV